MPQLDPTWFPSQFFWLAITFTLLFIGVKAVLPTMDKIFSDRNKIIDENIKVASELRDEAKKVLKAYEEGIASANEKSEAIMQNTKQEIESFVKEKDAEFEKKSAEMLKKSHDNLEKLSSEAMGDVKKMALDMTEMIYVKITNKDILKEQVTAAVEQVFNKRDNDE